MNSPLAQAGKKELNEIIGAIALLSVSEVRTYINETDCPGCSLIAVA
jgi:hypothetical protein